MLAIIQARFSSKRLEGKVLKKINNKFLLERVIDNVKCAKEVSRVIVATSKEMTDNKIFKFCKSKNIECYRGDLNNVYNRFYYLLKAVKDKSFVRICADSPFIDPYTIDYFIKFFKKNRYQIVTNIFPRSFPKGQSIEIFNSKIFSKNFIKIKKRRHQEHVTPYFYENSKKFNIKNIKYFKKYSNLNFCVDTNRDIRLARKIAKKFDNFKNKKKFLESIINFQEQI